MGLETLKIRSAFVGTCEKHFTTLKSHSTFAANSKWPQLNAFLHVPHKEMAVRLDFCYFWPLQNYQLILIWRTY